MRCAAIIISLGSFWTVTLAQAPHIKTAARPTPSGSPRTNVERLGRETPTKTRDQKRDLEAVEAVQAPADRALAARDFLAKFPGSKTAPQALDILIRSEIDEGYRRLNAGDPNAAVDRFAAALKETSFPFSDKLFVEVLSKLPPSLYFGGAREQGLRIATLIEEKTQGNCAQLLALANFYLSIENGTKARELANAAIKAKPESSGAYEMLGLGHRMDFQLDESAAAYEMALRLEPGSISARRGLAEMKRALGRSDEAGQLFQEILSVDGGNLPARTGLILSMFEAGRRNEAEAELSKAINVNPGNVMLLAGAAYWYATQENGERAVELAQQAINADPRFIWSHIALARGLILSSKPYDAERTLLAARRYGNFPTLEFEIASIRMEAGFFRDAVNEISKSFTISDGSVRTKLGGRILRSSKSFAELIALERRASILAPIGASRPQIETKLFWLLEMNQLLNADKPPSESLMQSVGRFVDGDDPMKLHRQLFAAGVLLEKRVELTAVVEIVQSAVANVDAGLDGAFSNSAVMASELFESRNIAIARGEYLNIPQLPRSTLSAIVRGRIEEINGWAKFQMGDTAGAAVRLKRAVSVLPPKSAWWQSASWRLGSALSAAGRDAEALDIYVQTYKSLNGADTFRYDTIAALFQKIHGSTQDLESLVGPDPRKSAQLTNPVASSDPIAIDPKANSEEVVKIPSPASSVGPAKGGISDLPPSPNAAVSSPTPTENSTVKTIQPRSAGIKEVTAGDLPSSSGETAAAKTIGDSKPLGDRSDIFAPIVITIPTPEVKGALVNRSIPFLPNPMLKPGDKIKDSSTRADEPLQNEPDDLGPRKASREEIITSQTSPLLAREVSPCILNSSEENLTIPGDSGEKAIIIGTENDLDLREIKARSSSPEYVSVRREAISGITTRALFVIRVESRRPGVYQVTFELSCGEKVIVVNVP
jgi:tetratricopeptide (TPR) repeat protein